MAEAAALLGPLASGRCGACARRFAQEGPAGLVHGNRGRASPRGSTERDPRAGPRARPDRYDGANDSHLAELLAEHEGDQPQPGRASGASCGRPASPARAAGAHRATAAAATGCPRRACCSRPTAAGTTGSRTAAAADPASAPSTTRPGAMTGGHVPRAGGRRGLPDRPARHDPPPRPPAGALPRPHTHLRDPEGHAARRSRSSSPTRRTPTQFGRALAELGHHLDRRPEPAGEGPHRARLGDVPGPPRGRAAAGRRARHREPPTGSWPASCRASTGASACPRPTPSLPGGRCRPSSGLDAHLLSQVPPGRRQRPHRPGRGHHPPAAGRAGSPGLCRSTGRAPAAARWPARRMGRRADGPRPPGACGRQSSSAPSITLVPTSVPPPRVSALQHSRRRTIPGGASSPGRQLHERIQKERLSGSRTR